MKRKPFFLTMVWLAVVVGIQSCQQAASPTVAVNQADDTPGVFVLTSTAGTIQPAIPATPTQTTRPTPVEPTGTTPPVQPTSTVELPELKAELFAFFGGGGPSCAYGPIQGNTPELQILSHSFPAPAQDTIVCLFNFPLNSEVVLEMIDPSGFTTEQKVYRVGNTLYEDEFAVVQQYSILEIPVSFPLSLGIGTWRVLASSNDAQAEGTFRIGDYDPAVPELRPGTPIVTHSPILPLAELTPTNPKLRAPYHAGDTVRIQGVFFPPNEEFRAGLYQGWDQLSLINSFVVTTDEHGAFSHDLRLDNDIHSGKYSIIPSPFITEDSVSEDYYARFLVQNEPARSVIEFDCQKETSLVIGKQAYLADQEANNLRLVPNSDGLLIGKLEPGEQLLVLDGPVCADGYLWWDVLSQDSNLVGWTAEGDESERWIMPLP